MRIGNDEVPATTLQPVVATPPVNLVNHFQGISNTSNQTLNGYGIEPPDTQGAVGPSSYVETVNTAVSLFSKTTGATIATDSLNTLFFTTGGLTTNPGSFLGDAFSTFVPSVQRFVVADIYTNEAGSDAIVLAVSKSAAPTRLPPRIGTSLN